MTSLLSRPTAPAHLRNLAKATLVAAPLLLSGIALTGCGTGVSASPTPIAGAAVRGTAMGGHQPVTGADIRLYAATTTGYGGAPVLLGADTSDANGNFSIVANGNTCANPSLDQEYIVASGGNPGAGVNSASVLVEALGPCASVTSSTTVTVNEETTVAAAYALTGFAQIDGSSMQIGTSTTNQVGLNHAFENALNLSTMNGFARATTVAGNGTVPQSLLNTLANSMAACVNSVGPTSPGCSNVLIAYPNGITPTNTWQMALLWAKYPSTNVTNILANSTPQTTFYSPTLATTPTDVSVGIGYTVGHQYDGTTAATAPVGLAIDANGYIFVSGMTGAPLVKLDGNGTLLSPDGGLGDAPFMQLTTVKYVALDNAAAPQAWVASSDGNLYGYNTVSGGYVTVPLGATELINGATSTTVSNAPATVAIDTLNNVWFGTTSTTSGKTNVIGEVLLNNDGTYSQRTTWAGSNIMTATNSTGSTYLAVNPNNNEVICDENVAASQILASPTASVTVSGSNYVAGAGIAFDGSTNFYALGTGVGSGNGKFNSWTATGTANYTAVSFGATAKTAYFNGLAVDGSGLAFITTTPGSAATTTYGTVLPYNTTSHTYSNGTAPGYSPINNAGGYFLDGAVVKSVQVDQAGAIWMANQTSGAAAPVVELLGVGTPTKAPLVTGYAALP